jgi:hypothetical protein
MAGSHRDVLCSETEPASDAWVDKAAAVLRFAQTARQARDLRGRWGSLQPVTKQSDKVNWLAVIEYQDQCPPRDDTLPTRFNG